jgi:hypothetical protein
VIIQQNIWALSICSLSSNYDIARIFYSIFDSIFFLKHNTVQLGMSCTRCQVTCSDRLCLECATTLEICDSCLQEKLIGTICACSIPLQKQVECIRCAKMHTFGIFHTWYLWSCCVDCCRDLSFCKLCKTAKSMHRKCDCAQNPQRKREMK